MKTSIHKYGSYAVLFLSLIIFSVTVASSQTSETAPASQDYVNAIVQSAMNKQLYADPYWKLLLHYKTGITGERSLIDDKKFFLSPKGKRNEKAELEATLRGFFSQPQNNSTAKHPALRFPARYFWLREQLHFDESKIPVNVEQYYLDLTKQFDPKTAILIFPAGYMSSPASMFGHTLLLLENSKKDKLVSMAVNYAARTDSSFGPTFAIKGLFGLYPGYFSFLPYYEKINEYNNAEMRDIWEYYLNLDDAEMKKMISHMIELENIYSRYFFVDENCSYNLLFLLEIARPSTNLTSEFTVTAEPITTIKVILNASMVKERFYRPSLYSRITITASQLNKNEIKAVQDFALGKTKSLPTPDSDEQHAALIYDCAADYLQFLGVKGKITQKEYSSRFFNLLKMRKSVNAATLNYSEFQPSAPETILPSGKFSIEGGRYSGNTYASATFRANYHELMDLDRGVTKNSTIVFSKLEGRYFPEDHKLILQRFYLFDILSLPESTSWYSFNCMRARTGVERIETKNGNSVLSGIIHLGGGKCVDTPLGQLYGFIEPDFNFSSEFKYNTLNTASAKVGLISQPTSFWKIHIYGKCGHSMFGSKTTVYEALGEQRIQLGDSMAISGHYKFFSLFNHVTHEYALAASLYF